MLSFWRKFLFQFRRRKFDEELAEEIRLHKELREPVVRALYSSRCRSWNVNLPGYISFARVRLRSYMERSCPLDCCCSRFSYCIGIVLSHATACRVAGHPFGRFGNRCIA